MPPADDVLQVRAAMAFGWMAASFVTEPETFGVFMTWARSRPGSGLPGLTREMALTLVAELSQIQATIVPAGRCQG